MLGQGAFGDFLVCLTAPRGQAHNEPERTFGWMTSEVQRHGRPLSASVSGKDKSKSSTVFFELSMIFAYGIL
jgi:hypothetical protein